MTEPAPDYVRHWPQRHRDDPRCHSVDCTVTDVRQLRYHLQGLCCPAHPPVVPVTVVAAVQEKEHQPVPVRLPTGRYGLLPDPRRQRQRRQPRKRTTA